MEHKELSLDTKRFIMAVAIFARMFDWKPELTLQVLAWGAGIERIIEVGFGFREPEYASELQGQFMAISRGEAVPVFNSDESDFSLLHLPPALAEGLGAVILSELAEVEAERS